jgi:Na+/H+ antiporter NhaD/arsenite permease-like protein
MRYIREYALLAIVLMSWFITGRKIRARNQFSWAPIVEIAYLFIGIFVTMTPALLFLNENAASLGLQLPSQYFYTTGLLSSVLDNTPTALAFHTVALGLPDTGNMVAGVPESVLKAIATGAVFFGAMTYIGNGPNFMVKSIAEEHRIKMPSFFAYMFKFSLIVLLPIYIIVQWIFF